VPIEKNFFRQVLGRFATGVAVVTTHNYEGLTGITVNSFCSVSLEPPLVLVCIDLKSTNLRYFRESSSFVVNMLSDQQECLSRCFATPSQDRYEHFCHAAYHVAVTGSPIIDNALAFLDTRIVAEYPGGDHAIFVGQVAALGIGGQVAFAGAADGQSSSRAENDDCAVSEGAALPLTYYRGRYRHLARDYRSPSLAAQNNARSHVTIG
jgi:flavin reductase (DIM6/NTAB) family NADH-FMN oxidoreductase RutF